MNDVIWFVVSVGFGSLFVLMFVTMSVVRNMKRTIDNINQAQIGLNNVFLRMHKS